MSVNEEKRRFQRDMYKHSSSRIPGWVDVEMGGEIVGAVGGRNGDEPCGNCCVGSMLWRKGRLVVVARRIDMKFVRRCKRKRELDKLLNGRFVIGGVCDDWHERSRLEREKREEESEVVVSRVAVVVQAVV